jgi:hypothetical protein
VRILPLLLSNLNHVVIGNSIDELVARIDASACRHLVHTNFKGLVFMSNLFLLQVERLLLVPLASENTNVNLIIQRHRSLVPTAI